MCGYQTSQVDQLSGSKATDTSHGQTHQYPLWLPCLLLIESSFSPPLFMGDSTYFFKLCPITKKYRFFTILS